VATTLLAVSAAGVIAGMLVGLRARSVLAGVGAMLELWMAASLLRLTEDGSWAAIGTVAVLFTVRSMLSRALGAAAHFGPRSREVGSEKGPY
jgi:hypothetical protein